MRLRALFLVTLFLSGLGSVSAQQVQVLATVDRTSLSTDDVVRYEIEVRGATVSSVAQPALPPLDGLAAQTDFPMMIGEEATGQVPRVTFRWALRPTRTGLVRIGAANVRVGGASGRTAPLSLTVRAGSGPPPAPADPDRAPFGGAPSARALAAGDVLLRATASADRAVVGEQVVVEYRLYARPDIDLRFSPAGSSNASGFWREDLVVPQRPLPQPATLNGRRYSSIVVQRVALFPTQAGRLVIPALTLEGEADVPVTSALYGVRGRRATPFSVTSTPLPLTVSSLPPRADGAGLTGNVTLAASLDTLRAETGQSLRLRVRITGDANLATLEAPGLALPDSAFDVFDPEAAYEPIRTRARLSATRTFTYGFVPRRAGTYRLPPVTLVVFNPEDRAYRTLKGHPGTLIVTVSAADAARAAAGSDALDTGESDPPQRAWWLLALGLLLALGFVFWRSRRIRPPAPPVQQAPSPAAPVRRQPAPPPPAPAGLLEEAEAALDAGDPHRAARALLRALDGIPAPGRASDAETLQTLRTRLNEALFAPTAPDTAQLRSHLAALRQYGAQKPATGKPAPRKPFTPDT